VKLFRRLSVVKTFALGFDHPGNVYLAGEAGGQLCTYDEFTVISLTATGRQRWVYQRGGTAGGFDAATSFARGPGDRLYAAGYLLESGAIQYFTVIGLDTLGNEHWVHQYNGSNAVYNRANALICGVDGRAYAAGQVCDTGGLGLFDFTVICVDSAGSRRWAYRYDGATHYDDEAAAIAQGVDGHLYVAGYIRQTSSHNDLAVVSLDTAGNQRWLYTPGVGESWATSVACGSDGSIYVGGTALFSTPDLVVFCLTPDGQRRWHYRHASPKSGTAVANAVAVGPDGNIYAAGQACETSRYFTDLVVASIDTAGLERWVYTVPGPGAGGVTGDAAVALAFGTDGLVYAAGRMWKNSDSCSFVVVCLDTAGRHLWTYSRPAGYGEANTVGCDPDGNVYAGGSENAGGRPRYVLLVSLEPSSGIAEELTPEPDLERVTPNVTVVRGALFLPATSERRTATAELLDAAGRWVMALHPGTNDVSRLSPGVYFVREAQAQAIRKVVVTR
ncbi:MAG: hypothetical protein NTX53_06310, partial [candidate division WOR-3 bacterium]|nr:hypothetical protein [candidate division WOR-3 bacterium]